MAALYANALRTPIGQLDCFGQRKLCVVSWLISLYLVFLGLVLNFYVIKYSLSRNIGLL